MVFCYIKYQKIARKYQKEVFPSSQKKTLNWHFSIWILLNLGEMRYRVRLSYSCFMLSKV